MTVLYRPGSDLLSRALRQSTIGAEAVNDRVRNGIGWGHLAITTRPVKNSDNTGFALTPLAQEARRRERAINALSPTGKQQR
jgi:hypothetical protein